MTLEETLRCSECGAPIKENQERCDYCGYYFRSKSFETKVIEDLTYYEYNSPVSKAINVIVAFVLAIISTLIGLNLINPIMSLIHH